MPWVVRLGWSGGPRRTFAKCLLKRTRSSRRSAEFRGGRSGERQEGTQRLRDAEKRPRPESVPKGRRDVPTGRAPPPTAANATRSATRGSDYGEAASLLPAGWSEALRRADCLIHQAEMQWPQAPARLEGRRQQEVGWGRLSRGAPLRGDPWQQSHAPTGRKQSASSRFQRGGGLLACGGRPGL